MLQCFAEPKHRRWIYWFSLLIILHANNKLIKFLKLAFFSVTIILIIESTPTSLI